MNLGNWPPRIDSGALLSPGLRRQAGLLFTEQRVGLATHDFLSLCLSSEVVLTRARMQEGREQLPSPFWTRLEVAPSKKDKAEKDTNWRHRVFAHEPRKLPSPAPLVSREHWPETIHATALELLMRDPYGFYLRTVLKLYRLDDIDRELAAIDKGSFAHQALETFHAQWQRTKTSDEKSIAARLQACLDEAFGRLGRHAQAAREEWEPRLRHAAQIYASHCARSRDQYHHHQAELEGRISFPIDDSAPPFALALATSADLVEWRFDDKQQLEALRITEFKTGRSSIASPKDIKETRAVQLILMALIAREGGLGGLPAFSAPAMAYWPFVGRAGSSSARDQIEDRSQAVLDDFDSHIDKIRATIKAHALEGQPMRIIPNLEAAPRFNDYAHLERLDPIS